METATAITKDLVRPPARSVVGQTPQVIRAPDIATGTRFIQWFADIGIDDIPLVGGKNASLGEMYRELLPQGVKVPNGFAITAEAYRYFLREAGLDQTIRDLLSGLDTGDMENLQQRGSQVRHAILATHLPRELEREITAAYDTLRDTQMHPADVAVRSSATAEDLPDASFAGQQETYLNVQGHLALLDYEKMDAGPVKQQIHELTPGYTDKPRFFVDKLAQGVAMIAAAFYPKDVILRLSDFKTNEYANLVGGRPYEMPEENPMIGFRGASRYYNPRYQAGFALECVAVKKVRDEMGLTNLKVMIPFCRTVEEGLRVQIEMGKHGLKRGKDGLEIYVMCEIPSNVILAEEFAEIFDGFSIGSNDLTQLILGVDRDSAIVAPIFNERNAAVKKMIAQVIAVCRSKGRKIGICGQAPSDYPEFAQFLVEQGIDSISLNSDTVMKTTIAILEQEKALIK